PASLPGVRDRLDLRNQGREGVAGGPRACHPGRPGPGPTLRFPDGSGGQLPLRRGLVGHAEPCCRHGLQAGVGDGPAAGLADAVCAPLQPLEGALDVPEPALQVGADGELLRALERLAPEVRRVLVLRGQLRDGGALALPAGIRERDHAQQSFQAVPFRLQYVPGSLGLHSPLPSLSLPSSRPRGRAKPDPCNSYEPGASGRASTLMRPPTLSTTGRVLLQALKSRQAPYTVARSGTSAGENP